MATLDTSDLVAVKFQVDTVVTLDTLDVTYFAGDVIGISKEVTSLTVDNTTAVAVMTDSALFRNTANQDRMQVFTPDAHRQAV